MTRRRDGKQKASPLQGGCRGLAEDAQDVFFEVKQALEAGNVCIVVVTPKVTRSASGCADGIPVEMQLAVQCAERPDLNCGTPGHLTALDAAEHKPITAIRRQLQILTTRPSLSPQNGNSPSSSKLSPSTGTSSGTAGSGTGIVSSSWSRRSAVRSEK